ncbi:ABC transporter ATP-binding protein [Mycobacterium sp. M26]|uniref:ABC transporter ATP-binding protein n=1 Tax=Mycobacterium sp. M26 TaxID=1762962 RepID=UPI00073E4C69|nr:ABC transporter ATP-binding protein [Mycobacterium sp. M26]
MLGLLRTHWKPMAGSLLLLGVAAVLTLLQPLMAGLIVDRAAAGAPILALIVVLAVLLVSQLALESVGQFQLDRTGENIVRAQRTVFTNHVVRLPIGVLDRTRTGELLARGTNDAGVLREVPRAIGDIAFGTLALLGAGAFMVAIDALTVVVVVALLAIALAASIPFLSRIQRAALARQAALSEYTAALERALGAARTVKLFGAEDREAQSIAVSAQAAYEAGVRIASSTAIAVRTVRLAVTASFLAIMLIDGRRVADGSLTIGQFVTLFTFGLYAIFPITAAVRALTELRTAAGAYQHLTATLRSLPEDNPASPTVVTPAELQQVSQGSALVEFDRVSFAYGTDTVLNEVSFHLDRDRITALIGPSGAGKSTILALLCRFHEPAGGVIRWDGHDVRDIPIGTLRSRLGLLEQDAPVLHGTIRDNLLIADPQAGDDDLWRVLRQANLADEIAGLPGQLDAPVLQHGRSLSGGQRQRLALARALLSRSQLILMDEPTAHLDRANEYDVMTNLAQARGERSVFVVAHRLSTVTTADQILVLRDGRIQASGTHQELLDMPVYRNLIEQEFTQR